MPHSNWAFCAACTAVTDSAFLMVTFGLTLIMGEVIRLVWGVEALQVHRPTVSVRHRVHPG